jgi:protein involved in polysaccharide export with SLBB domain
LPQLLGADGLIQVPYVGPVPVLGLNEAQITRLVQGLLQPVFGRRIDLSAHLE